MTTALRLLAMCAAVAATAAVIPGAAVAWRIASTGISDPLAFATGVGIAGDEFSRVESGRAVVSVIPTRDRDFAAFGIVQTQAQPVRLIEWSRAVARFYRGSYVPLIGQFSSPPRAEDLATLTLDEEDLADLRTCRPGKCGLKLSAVEIGRIRGAAEAAGDRWTEAVQTAFREVVLARAQSYFVSGLAAAPPYFDREQPVSPVREYAEVASRIGLEPLYGSRALAYFEEYPRGDSRDVESILYWSKEMLGGGRPIVSITHLAIVNAPAPTPHALVAARQVFASHYLDASLSFTIVTADSSPRYLVYLRRSRIDAFDGMFGWFIRGVVERRIRAEGPALLDGLRRKLEESDPAGSDSAS